MTYKPHRPAPQGRAGVPLDWAIMDEAPALTNPADLTYVPPCARCGSRGYFGTEVLAKVNRARTIIQRPHIPPTEIFRQTCTCLHGARYQRERTTQLCEDSYDQYRVKDK